jgi:hypothetical protein
MAKTLVFHDPTRAVVIVSGANANETIDLDVDLDFGNQVPATPHVVITNLIWSIPANTGAITRNSVALWSLSLFGNIRMDGWNDNREKTSDIVVTLGAGGGSIVLELKKQLNFGDEQHRNNNYGWA